MYFTHNKKIFSSVSPENLVKLASIVIAVFFLGQTKAQSQSNNLLDHTHPNVTVDLSVISGSGSNQISNLGNITLPNQGNRELLRPGNQTPRSMLHVPVAKGAPSLQLKTKSKNKLAPKSVLHVPPANVKSKSERNKKVKAEPAPKKVISKQKKKIALTATKPAKKIPPASAKVSLPAKPTKPEPVPSSEAPKKLQANVGSVTEKPAPAPVKNLKQADPPSTPSIKAAPKISKKELSTPPTKPIAKNKSSEQQASITPTDSSAGSVKKLRVSFDQDQTKLPINSKKPLISLAESLKGTTNQRLQIMAYAGGPSLSSSLARRMSLSRALAIRSFLIENGVRSTRIDVRALGNKTTEEPLNRVDLKVTER